MAIEMELYEQEKVPKKLWDLSDLSCGIMFPIAETAALAEMLAAAQKGSTPLVKEVHRHLRCTNPHNSQHMRGRSMRNGAAARTSFQQGQRKV